MAKKQNPILAQFEAMKEAQFKERMAIHTEINLLSLIIAADDEELADVGGLLMRYIQVKMKLAEDIVEDSKDDPSLVYTKADVARRVKSVLSREDWERFRELFPLLKDYWED
jgi:hypothetical protein